MRWLWVVAVGLLAACAATADDGGPRLELEGDVGSGGFGGITAVGGGDGGVDTTATSTTTVASSTSTGEGGGVGGMMCDTGDEPNDSEDTARDLGSFNDCDGNGAQIAFSLEPNDVDWFRYQGSDDFGCVVDPSRSLTSTGDVRMCKFAECLDGDVDVTCEDGSSSATSPNGHPGCCHDRGFGMDIDCPGTDDDAVITIRFDQHTGCTGYVLDYHY